MPPAVDGEGADPGAAGSAEAQLRDLLPGLNALPDGHRERAETTPSATKSNCCHLPAERGRRKLRPCLGAAKGGTQPTGKLMKLEPVYLVGPKKKQPSMPSRRAFLMAGGACGYALGSARAEAASDPLASTGDAQLDELRRLAVKAPLKELLERAFDFLTERASNYHKDEVLWIGVGSIARAVVVRPGDFDRAVILMTKAAFQGTSPPAHLHLEDILPEIRRLNPTPR
jgi:hypothetical protein